jgi:hypothetical protein
MVSELFFYQLALIALLWLCCMLQWVWPSERVIPGSTLPPHLRCYPASARGSRNRLQV